MVNATPTPAGDAKPNSDKVPDVYSVSGKFDGVLVLVSSLTPIFWPASKKWSSPRRFATPSSSQRPVRSVDITFTRSAIVTFRSKNMYEKDPVAPADLIGMNGYIMDGKIHAHMTLATPDKAFGDISTGTAVFTFAIVTIGVMNEGVDFRGLDDKTIR